MIARIGDLEIWYETFGDSSNPPILLIMGAGSQGILWPDDFCNELASNHFYVIRYDHRDTGFSTCINYKEHPYSLKDLSNDVLELLNTLNIDKAHVVGLSMGGYIVQLLEINNHERLITATIIMSTPDHMVLMNALAGKTISANQLPPPKSEILEFFSNPPEDMHDREKMVNYTLATWKLLNGSNTIFDEDYWRKLITRQYDRTQNHTASYNHGRACLASSEDRTILLKKTRTPTLVIHGLEDPMLPVAHGQALANAIPNAKLLIIEKMGHSLNPIFQNQIITAILSHIESTESLSK